MGRWLLQGLGGQMTILIKPFLFLIAFGPLAVLFASVFGLVCLLLMTCVRAIAWLPRAATELLNAVNPSEPRRAALYIRLPFARMDRPQSLEGSGS
jgi:hypothetical protein